MRGYRRKRLRRVAQRIRMAPEGLPPEPGDLFG